MGKITTKDGVEIVYKDWGKGQPIVFSHGWPLSADDWDAQMLFFLNQGYRVIAHDRRGHGRSTQTGDGPDMDHYAVDLAAVTEHLDLKDAIHVGHSTGGGEVAHYLGQHGESRVAKAALLCAVPPLMVKTPSNPNGLPKEVFDDLQAQLAANRSNFYRVLPERPFYGFNRPGAQASEDLLTIADWVRGFRPCADTMRRRTTMKKTTLLLTVAAALLATSAAAGETIAPGANVSVVFDQALPNVPGKSMRAVLVDYGPGAGSPSHRHPNSAFIYARVLEGAIRSKVNDGPERTYKAGESWTEKPGDHHQVSHNASDTEPAKLLAIFVVDTKDNKIVIPDK